MARFSWSAMGFLLGLAAAACSAPAPSACDPSFCSGCCDATGRCMPGLDATACGQAGAACAVCDAQQSCTDGACTGGSAGGAAGSTGGSGGSGGGATGGSGGGIAYDGGSKAAACASTFGSALTNAYGRVDGTITAVVTPADTQCAMPNNDHLVVQVLMNGAIYRMVVNVLSTQGPPEVSYRTLDAPLQGGAWAEGWHTGVTLDYPTNLGVHSDAGFAPVPMANLVPAVSNELDIGAHVSVFSTSSGGVNAMSTHLIHRNGNNNDGAIVVNPDGASPRWLLFHFPQQSF